MMKSKGQTEHDEGMLEYLEDIIGSCRLKEPIQTLARRIELLNEQRGEKVTYTHTLSAHTLKLTNFPSCVLTLFAQHLYSRGESFKRLSFVLGRTYLR